MLKSFLWKEKVESLAGATYETINSAWGLGLDNLIYHLDWNDYGIDSRPFSSVLYGTPENWFGGHGWQVVGVENGECWEEITKAYYNVLVGDPEPSKPKIVYCKTRKGRGYLKYDFHIHGSPHKMNSNLFWETKRNLQVSMTLILRILEGLQVGVGKKM